MSKRNIVIIAAVSVVALVGIYLIFLRASEKPPATVQETEDAHKEDEVKLSPEALAAAGIEIEGVTERPAVALLQSTGTVEANQQQSQQATPLVGGRIEQVNVSLGDRVRAGAVLAVIASPQIAQMHGKLHEAETQRALAERNLERVLRAENRVAVLSAKARLDEAEATLRRVRRLVELGAGAGKDLIAAETAQRTAKAEYEFQSNISLNREVQEARAAVETARVDVSHIRDEMRAFGAPVPEGERHNHDKDTSLVAVRAAVSGTVIERLVNVGAGVEAGKPLFTKGERHNHDKDTSLVAVRAAVSGTVIERLVNVGAGVEAGKPLFTIGNLSTVWVIANVPEAQIAQVHVGTPVEITAAALGDTRSQGHVAYIDPQLNEDTRTARVRIEMPNAGERLKAGMFVQVGFQAGAAAAGQELVIKSEALQRIGDRTVVFIPKDEEPGAFEIREVQVGAESGEYTRVLAGLEVGQKVVTKGSFTLKTQMMKGELGDHDH